MDNAYKNVDTHLLHHIVDEFNSILKTGFDFFSVEKDTKQIIRKNALYFCAIS